MILLKSGEYKGVGVRRDKNASLREEGAPLHAGLFCDLPEGLPAGSAGFDSPLGLLR